MAIVTFASRDHLVERFGEAEIASLEDPDRIGEPDDQISSVALVGATQELLGYIAPRYGFTLSTIPITLRDFTCDIARYKMYKDRPTDEVDKRYKRAIAWGKDVSTGTVALEFDQIRATLTTSDPAVVIGFRGGFFDDRHLAMMPRIDVASDLPYYDYWGFCG